MNKRLYTTISYNMGTINFRGLSDCTGFLVINWPIIVYFIVFRRRVRSMGISETLSAPPYGTQIPPSRFALSSLYAARAALVDFVVKTIDRHRNIASSTDANGFLWKKKTTDETDDFENLLAPSPGAPRGPHRLPTGTWWPRQRLRLPTRTGRRYTARYRPSTHGYRAFRRHICIRVTYMFLPL